MTEQDQQDRQVSAEAFRPQRGPEPLERLVEALRRPVTLGAAVALTALNLVVVGTMLSSQNQQLERIGTSVGGVDSSGPAAGSDREACWLVGAAAHVQGHGKELVAHLAAHEYLSDCYTLATRGAMGQDQAGQQLNP